MVAPTLLPFFLQVHISQQDTVWTSTFFPSVLLSFTSLFFFSLDGCTYIYIYMYIYISNSPQTVCCSSFVFFSNGICLHRSFFKGLTSSLLLLSYFSHLQCFSSPFFFLAPAAKTKKRFLIIVSYCLFFFFWFLFVLNNLDERTKRYAFCLASSSRLLAHLFFFFYICGCFKGDCSRCLTSVWKNSWSTSCVFSLISSLLLFFFFTCFSIYLAGTLHFLASYSASLFFQFYWVFLFLFLIARAHAWAARAFRCGKVVCTVLTAATFR